MEKLLAGLFNSVRKAASSPRPAESGGAGSSSSSSKRENRHKHKKPHYSQWVNDVSGKMEDVSRLLSALLQRQERVNEFQSQLKKLNTALNEIDGLMVVDSYEEGKRDLKDHPSFIDQLLEFWYKLILLLDKVDIDHGVNYLNSMHRVAIRPEFDLMFFPVLTSASGDSLKISPEQLVVMRRYLTLLFNTYSYIVEKLSDTSPIGANSPIVRFQTLHTAYARLLSVAFFRLPHVARLVIESCSLEQTVVEQLQDFTITFAPAANANFTGAELLTGPQGSSRSSFKSSGSPRMGGGHQRSASASPSLQSSSSNASSSATQSGNPQSLSPPRQRVILPAPQASTSPPGAPAPSPLLSRVRRDFAAPTGVPSDDKTLATELAWQNAVSTSPPPLPSASSSSTPTSSITNAFSSFQSPPPDSTSTSPRGEFGDGSPQKSTTVVTIIKTPAISMSVPTSPQPSKLINHNTADPLRNLSSPTSPFDIPPLFSWNKLHQTILKSDHSRLSNAWNETPRRKWLSWFSRGESALFIIFFREWISHVQLMLDRTRHCRRQLKMADPAANFKWPLVEGFTPMLQALLFNLRQYDRPSKLLMDASKALLSCEPELINFLVKYVYTRTNIYNMDHVNNMFTKLDVWFSELERLDLTLPKTFDAAYFCSGLELLIELDHHQLTGRILAFIFTNAHLMVGDVRRIILYEFILKKYFFRLFLHWDDVVRNYFHQLLIYKMVRIPRTQLAEAGFHAPEIAVLQTHHSPAARAQLSSEEDLLDMKIFTNISAYVRTVEDQLRSPDHPDPTFDRSLEIYAPKALAEYRYYLSRYEENGTVPKLIPMHMLQERKLPPGVQAQPTRLLAKSNLSDDMPS